MSVAHLSRDTPHAVPRPPFHVTISSDLGDFGDLWPNMLAPHERLGGACAYVFQCRELLSIWLRTIGVARGTRPLFVQVSGQNRAPLMLIPLGIENRRGVRVLSFLDSGVCDYNAPVLFPGADQINADAMHGIWRQIESRLPAHDALVLEKIPEHVFELANPLWALAPKTWPVSGHLVTLNFSAEDFLRTRGPNPPDSRRKRKRLAEIGPLSFRVAEGAEEMRHIYKIMIRQKTRRFMETGGFDNFKRPGWLAFYTALTEELPTHVQLAAFSVGDAIIATHWGILSGDRFYYLGPAWEGGEWTKFSPGRLLVENLIVWALENGFRTFDLGIGDEPYKLKIRDAELKLGCLRVGRTMRGKLYLASTEGRRALAASRPGRAFSAWRHRRRKERVGLREAETRGE